MSKHYSIITLDLDLDIIHRLYSLAITRNTTVDEIVNQILKEYIEEKTNETINYKMPTYKSIINVNYIVAPSGLSIKVGSKWFYSQSLDNSKVPKDGLTVKTITKSSNKPVYIIAFKEKTAYKYYDWDYFDGETFWPTDINYDYKIAPKHLCIWKWVKDNAYSTSCSAEFLPFNKENNICPNCKKKIVFDEDEDGLCSLTGKASVF